MGEVIRGGSTSLTSAEFGVLDDRPSPSMLVLVATLAAATVCQGAFTAAGRWLVGLGLVAAIGLDVTGECWISLTADGGTEVARLYRAGEHERIEVTRELVDVAAREIDAAQ